MFKYISKRVNRYAEEIAEVVAPTHRTKQEEFRFYWTTVSDLLTNKATGVSDADTDRDDDDDVEEAAKVFQYLDRMLDMLTEEESQHDGMGPCMEFMLQSGVLKHLVHCGQFKWPAGIMGKVLRFFGGLLADIKQTPMIPDKHVYGPLKNLMLVHAQTPGLVEQNEEAAVEFLVALCDKLGQFPGYADFFIQTKQDSPDVFLPAVMLQPLLVSENDSVAVSARDCLRIVLQMQSPTVDAIVVAGRMESAFIVQHFVRLFAALPPHFESEEIQVHTMEWSESRYDGWKRFTPGKHAQTPEDARAFFEFMDWVHYCDDIMDACSADLATHLLGDIIARFFVAQIVPMLTQQSEEVAYATTCYVTACVTQISSPMFLRRVAAFLLGPPTCSPDTGGAGAPSPTSIESSERVCSLLVQRCDDISDELSAATLHLFCRLLRKRDHTILQALVLKHAKTQEAPMPLELRAAMRAMADQLTAEMPENLRSDEQDASYKEHFIDAQKAVLESRRTGMLVNCESSEGAQTADSGEAADEGPTFDDDEVEEVGEGAGSAGPAVEAVNDEGADDGLKMAGSVVEMDNPCSSPFLQVLARKLRQLPNQPHSLNLLVTANYVALLEYSSPVLQAVLLTPNDNSLFAAFSAVCHELRSKSARIDNVEARLHEEREKLATLLQAETLHQMSKSLQAMIVLEEFSKEVAARLLVQCNEMLLDT